MSVRDDGSPRAKLVLIGEAPGAREMEAGVPFVGPSGAKLKEWWHSVGLKREDFYITNVLDYQPPAIDRVPRAELESAFDRLHAKLSRLDDPWLIVPTGAYALYALTGKGKVSWHARDGHHPRPGITSWRGSILEYIDERRRRIKVIPTIHPAATFRTPGYERVCRLDWARIAGDSLFRELRLPVRTHRIRPSLADVLDYADRAGRFARELAIDIETPRRVVYETEVRELSKCECKHAKRSHLPDCQIRKCPCMQFRAATGKPKRKRFVGEAYLGCIGFSYDPAESLTIPLTLDYWGNPDDAAAARLAVKRLCESPVPKVLQNGLFDAYWLATEGIQLANFRYDTRAMSHCLEPTQPHDLAYMASVYTRESYWKADTKDPDEIARYASNSDTLWTYNGKDVCVTLELYRALREELERAKRMDYYERHYADLLAPLLALSLHGIRVDESRRNETRVRLDTKLRELATRISELAGVALVSKSGISTKRLKEYLYETLRLPKQYAKNTKKERTVSTNEVALRKLMLRFPDKLRAVGELILEFRRKKQLQTFVREGLTDPDGRMRALFHPFAETGRMRSQENPKGTGRNLQNIDRELRDVFVPD